MINGDKSTTLLQKKVATELVVVHLVRIGDGSKGLCLCDFIGVEPQVQYKFCV